MKQCCLCGKSGHEASKCEWNRDVPMSKIGHATFTVMDEIGHAISMGSDTYAIVHRAVSTAFELEFGKCKSNQS